MSQLVVVFRARAHAMDEEYLPTALRMRDKALAEYGCTEFVFAATPDGEEIALSYWPDEASIARWKKDLEHQAAQEKGRTLWYASYRVQVAEIRRDYGSEHANAVSK
jgi:heme-degrading monooxygenase HmoA